MQVRRGPARLSVVVPAFREERIGATVVRLRDELAGIHQHGGLEIIVVDDGSGDGTADRADAAGADLVIRQPVNRGKGAAVRAGMLAATGATVAFTDADLAYAPVQLIGLLDRVEAGHDVVFGNRYHPDSSTVVEASLLRRLGGRGVNLLTRTVLRGHYADTQCGLKAFRSDVAHEVFGRCRIDGFAFDIEVLHLTEQLGLSHTDVSVEVENSARSTVRVGRDAMRLAADVRRIRRWSRSGAYTQTVAPVRSPAPSPADTTVIDLTAVAPVAGPIELGPYRVDDPARAPQVVPAVSGAVG
jgi:dolichyl-phosphate beta-glucosyltransferase